VGKRLVLCEALRRAEEKGERGKQEKPGGSVGHADRTASSPTSLLSRFPLSPFSFLTPSPAIPTPTPHTGSRGRAFHNGHGGQHRLRPDTSTLNRRQRMFTTENTSDTEKAGIRRGGPVWPPSGGPGTPGCPYRRPRAAARVLYDDCHSVGPEIRTPRDRFLRSTIRIPQNRPGNTNAARSISARPRAVPEAAPK